MTDHQERLGRSLIQHGPENDRIYLMELSSTDLPDLIGRLDKLARQKNYSKVFAKVPATHHLLFRQHGYRTEALIPSFFAGRDDGHFMARYLHPGRAEITNGTELDEVLEAAKRHAEVDGPPRPPDGYSLRRCTETDAPTMARLYGEVFPSYPFPIQQPEFLAGAMVNHVSFFGVWYQGELVALASAEKSPSQRHVEMTDFATAPEHRGQGLASVLLYRAEAHALLKGYITAFTIARALSRGMNTVFARAGYHYAGRLINNTQISGHIESMNIWFKEQVTATKTRR